MEAKNRFFIAGALVLVAGIAVLWIGYGHGWDEGSPTSASETPRAEPVHTAAALVEVDIAVPVGADAPAGTPQRTEMPILTPKRKNATLRGRCVDANGVPLAGCKVHLHAWTGNTQRMDQWLTEHGEKPEWNKPPDVITGADGTFAFSFWPPPPFQFALDVTRDGCGALSGRWSTLAEGSDTNVGDLALTAGVRVSGRVVDDKGIPQDKEYVTLNRRDRNSSGSDRVGPRWGEQAVSRADGSFQVRGWLTPGEYEVQTQKLELQSPKTLTLSAERPSEEITVVVAKPPAVMTITGRVLDDTGAPARDVSIGDRSERGWNEAASRRDGTFELKKLPADGAKVARLALHSHAYDIDVKEPREVEWGATDVEFLVARAGALTLRLTDPQQAPVLTYTVRLIPRNRNRSSSLDSRVRTEGKYEDGTVVIDGMTRGEWLLLVDFPSSAGLEPLYEVFTHEGGPRRMDLSVMQARTRSLRVVTGNDAPVAGTVVQLCDVFDKPLDDERMVMRRDNWLMNSGSGRGGRIALVLFEGTTDADGRVELRGPGGRDLGVCLLGPGHVPLRRSGIRLDPTDELVVQVSHGARLAGQIVPPEAVAELKRLAGADASAGFPDSYRPRIALIDAQGRVFPKNHITARDLKSLHITDDGSFNAEGLPPGSWKVKISGWIAHQGGAGSRDFPAGNVDLVDGQTTTTDLDLAHVLPGTLEGLVLLNGQPFAKDTITLRSGDSWVNVQTDAEGRFRQSVFPGDYTLMLQTKRGLDMSAMLRCATPVHVRRGETTTQTFAVVSATLRITVLDSEGKPVTAAVLHALVSDKDGSYLPPTNADGVVETELTAETVTLRILPKALSAPESQRELWQEAQARGDRDPLALHWITLQTIALHAGQATAIETRLPASAGY